MLIYSYYFLTCDPVINLLQGVFPCFFTPFLRKKSPVGGQCCAVNGASCSVSITSCCRPAVFVAEKSHISPSVVKAFVAVSFLGMEAVRYGSGTRPLKPMKAMARMPAVTSAIGTPFMPRGVPVRSSCSRMPAKSISASAKPTAMLAE